MTYIYVFHLNGYELEWGELVAPLPGDKQKNETG